MYNLQVNTLFEAESSKRYKLASAHIKDSDQPSMGALLVKSKGPTFLLLLKLSVDSIFLFLYPKYIGLN